MAPGWSRSSSSAPTRPRTESGPRPARWTSPACGCRTGSRSPAGSTSPGPAATWSSTPRPVHRRRRSPPSSPRSPRGLIMFQPIRTDPTADLVRRITLVPFLADGRCVLIDEPGGPALPSGEVVDGEDYLLDTVLRVPLETAGFRYQRFHPFGLDRDHLYAWIEGGPYTGGRPHRTAALRFCSVDDAVRRLDEYGEPVLAAAVQAAAASYRTLDEQAFHADNRRTLEPAYLRGT